MQIAILCIGLLLMFSVPFIHSKMCPSKLYKNCKVVALRVKASPFEHDVMTIEKQGHLWSLPISRNVFNQISEGSIIDFYYNGEEAVTAVELSVFNQ